MMTDSQLHPSVTAEINVFTIFLRLLRHYPTSREVVDSIPDETSGSFYLPNPEVDSVINGKEYQESSWR
jgi:hypothetical protein